MIAQLSDPHLRVGPNDQGPARAPARTSRRGCRSAQAGHELGDDPPALLDGEPTSHVQPLARG